MSALGVWRLLWILCCTATPAPVSGVASEESCADDYDNDITPGQAEGDSAARPCQTAEFSRWDKLFIALEDSHMRQNMALDSLERCCGGTAALGAQLQRLESGTTCQQCLPVLEAACRGQAERAERATLRLQRGLADIREEEAEREGRINSTLQQLLRGSQEQNARLKRMEEDGGRGEDAARGGGPVGAGHGGTITQRPRGAGAGLGLKTFLSDSKQQDVTSPTDLAKMEKALVGIATELQRVLGQLSKLMEHLG